MPTKKTSASRRKKYIFVVGGVMSGVGKGITASSIGVILQARGFKVTAVKIDPYVNIDAGTMNPTEHGEVFVLSDGYETDQDMGNYERFLNVSIPSDNYMTTGRVYLAVIEKERNLKYKGKCVQVVPHIPLEVISRIQKASEKADADITVIEIGGTVGEYENVLFIEAVRMMELQNPEDVSTVMVSYLPVPSMLGEMKTKPTQHAVRALNSNGIQPNVIIARSSKPLDFVRKEKIALFCNMRPENVISAPDIGSIYDVPINFEKDKLSDILLKSLHLTPKKDSDLSEWKKFTTKTKNATKEVNIAVVGKYFSTGDFVLSDAYISVIEALKHASYTLGAKPKLTWLSAEEFEGAEGKKNLKTLAKYDGILVPGGFGSRGIEGKLAVIHFAREHKIPYFGLCYGMQLAVIEFARNVLGLKDANTAEIDPKSKDLVIDIMPDQKKKMKEENYGGTMRLGSYTALLQKETLARKAYNDEEHISERHRHRYEVNPEYVERLKQAGLVFSGTSPDGILMEIAELPEKIHPFFLSTQFHPELQSRPLAPHPLFVEFIRKSLMQKK
ncbi:MAG: CTP synthase [Candidatus Paceibacterota bacterium]|nr:CTP synthase [Candidatus Paceibacterota bacterium]